MCSIDSLGTCINKYCSCKTGHNPNCNGFLGYDIYHRSIFNRLIGYIINLYRKPKNLSNKEPDTSIIDIIKQIKAENRVKKE